MSAIDIISFDLDWREREIASMRILLSGNWLTNSQRSALLRAGWAMLYAHYEGFIKNTLTIFYDEAAKAVGKCEDLPKNTKTFALRDPLKALRTLSYFDLLNKIENFSTDHLTITPQFPDIDTTSNLWPHVLIELLETADMDTSIVKKYEVKLRTLVSRRNNIAHGEKDYISELSYYLGFEGVVFEVLYDIALQVDNRLSLPPYVLQ
jgi:hypothetical protein